MFGVEIEQKKIALMAIPGHLGPSLPHPRLPQAAVDWTTPAWQYSRATSLGGKIHPN